MYKKQGLLIVIDGIDGSGKTTQIELLGKYLSRKNILYEVISFPQYGKNKYSRQIKQYLEGKLGQLREVDPYFIAKAYANDRLTSKDLINSWLTAGKLVIANRYVSASKAHLGANLPPGKREEFFKWLDKLEYGTNGMPKEDLTILLRVDLKVGQKNVQSIHGADLHEESIKHLAGANKIYLDLAKRDSSWYVVDCMKDGEMKSREEIHGEIMEEIFRLMTPQDGNI